MIDSPRVRHSVLGIVALALFAALFTRLWYLQVLIAPEYRLLAENVRSRVVIEEAPRGRILDRNGNVLVGNRRSLVVTVDWQGFDKLDTPDQNQLLTRLARELQRDQIRLATGQAVPNDPGPPPPDPGIATTTAPGTPTTQTGTVPGAEEPADPGAIQPRLEIITAAGLRKRLNDPRFSKFKPVPVAQDISEELEVYLREHEEDFPTVAAERRTVRSYRYGKLLAHVLGYVGAVNEADLEQYQNPSKPYERDDDVGKTGIERGMEEQLRGRPGAIRYEVDPRNRPVGVLSERAPEPGQDVYLTVDINLQYMVEKGLAGEVQRRKGQGREGAVKAFDPPGASAVSIDPRSGQVLAMASYPTYDPNLFIGGITTEDYKALTDPAQSAIHRFPLTNRAVSGQYAPGSTFKLFSAYAGLASGQIDPNAFFNDTGRYYFCENRASRACYKQNAGGKALGPVNLTQSITRSSDTYYYKLGDESWRRRASIGEEALQQQYRLWGLGEKTGIPLPGESPGRVPTPKWRGEFAAELYPDDPATAEANGRWTAGASANMVIGQGDSLATPLQLANGYAAFANGGTLYAPTLVLQVTRYASRAMLAAFKPRIIRQIPFQPGWREAMLAGFEGVTKPDTGGTATATFSGFDQSRFNVAGKTGTAQATDKNDSSLFAAFAPAQAPTIAMAAIIEEAGFGTEAAAPLVRRVLEPLAPSGGDLKALPKAPLGGAFDVNLAVQEFVPPVNETND